MSSYTFNLPGFSPSPRTAKYWEPDSADPLTAVCGLCPHRCRIAPGKSGFCRTRVNRNGSLTIPYYGRCTSLAVDPIEKKPLNHFYPATPILSIGTAGCNLSCRFCQNWQISQTELPPETLTNVSPARLAETAEQRGIPAVAFTYNEPAIWAEYVIDAAGECRRRGIRTVAVTNGMIAGRAREEFYAVMDAVNIDLKAFTSSFYRDLCAGDLETVKETIRYAVRETGVWVEVTNLIIPAYNDDAEEIARLTGWLAETAGPDVPIHFSAFFPTYKLTGARRTPPETIYAALETAEKSGLRYAYAGNIGGKRGQSTFCPQCGEEVITRSGYQTSSRVIAENGKGVCPRCGGVIAGRFGETEKK